MINNITNLYFTIFLFNLKILIMYLNYKFAIVDPYTSNAKLILEEELSKKQ